MVEESRIDAKPLNFNVDQDSARDGQVRRRIKIAPGPQVSEAVWLASIASESNQEIARRLGVTDRQVRRSKPERSALSACASRLSASAIIRKKTAARAREGRGRDSCFYIERHFMSAAWR
jgi:hypothetical protein